ncbi:DNA translocase FtsK, partial [Oceanospirillum sp. HFRX-1_2]
VPAQAAMDEAQPVMAESLPWEEEAAQQMPAVQEGFDTEPTMEERLAAVTQVTDDGEIWSVARFQKPDTTPVGEITGDKPSIDLLTQGDSFNKPSYTPEQLQTMSELLEVRLKEFNVVAQVVDVHPGPVITRFEIQPAAGVKASKITNLATDLARALAVTSVRVVEVIAGKSSVGIEIPNQN